MTFEEALEYLCVSDCTAFYEISNSDNSGNFTNYREPYVNYIDFDGLIKHFEGLFQDGMTWENKNWWHVDHIVPISVAQTIDEAKYLNHYTNLRPIWSSDNIKKSNTIDETNIEKYNEFLKKMRNN